MRIKYFPCDLFLNILSSHDANLNTSGNAVRGVEVKWLFAVLRLTRPPFGCYIPIELFVRIEYKVHKMQQNVSDEMSFFFHKLTATSCDPRKKCSTTIIIKCNVPAPSTGEKKRSTKIK